MTGAPRIPRPALFAALCVALLALNPLTHATDKVSGGLFPDSIAYLAFAEGLRHGALFLDGWSHADAGLILPPLYPALVALLGSATGDLMAASYAVSTVALLLATVPLLWLACRLAGPVAGFAAVAVVQAHPLVLEFGAAALTEAPFVLLLAIGACLLASHTGRPAAWKPLAIGLVAAMLFLTRHIGGFFWPLAAVLVALRALVDTGSPRAALAPALGVTAAFAALVLPYAIALHAQTGHGPLTQSFRHMDYAVAVPQGFAPPPAAGRDVYAQRREQRQLLPDGSEMPMWTVPAAAATASAPWRRLAALPQHLSGNLKLLRQSLGIPVLALLGLALLSPLFARVQGPEQWLRLLLPATLLAYLVALSLFTGLVLRYVQLVVPLAMLQVFAEAAWFARRLPPRVPLLAAGLVAMLAVVAAASLPAKSWSVPLSARIGERGNPLAACRAGLRPGEPIFAFHPLGAYLLGGRYRVIPNDALDRVVTYAGHTGVRHMLVTVLPFEQAEMAYYNHSPWIEDLLQLDRHDPRIEVRCRSADGVAALYSLEGARRD